MSNAKTGNSDSLLRIPRPKNKFGLRVPKIAMPHEELISAENFISGRNSVEESKITGTRQTGQTGLTTGSSKTSLPALDLNSSGSHKLQVENDFQLPNSLESPISHSAAKLFIGKDKDLYEILYLMTLGSAEPKKKIRISKKKIMKLAGIGSRVTFDLCVERLKSKKLLNLQVLSGEHEGNEFEVMAPQKSVTLPDSNVQTVIATQASLPGDTNKISEAVNSHPTQTTQTREQSSDKNLFQLDSKEERYREAEEFTAMVEILSKVSKQYSEELKSNYQEDWRDLAELLAGEVKSAAQTELIANVPAFLTALLRRRLSNEN